MRRSSRWCVSVSERRILGDVIRIVVCYATAGAGHRRAAEAIAETASARWPTAQVDCVDILDHTPQWFHATYSWSYLFLVQRAPWIWWISYSLLDHDVVFRGVRTIRRLWNRLLTRQFVRWLQAAPPSIVVAAHFLPADVCGAAKRAGWLRAPLVVVVTDWHPHWFWLAPEADAVVTATAEGASVCRRRGVAAERLHVIGIPIQTTASIRNDREGLLSTFGLEVGRRTVLVTSGGTTVGPFEGVVTALMEHERTRPGELQLLVVCGESEGAVRRLREQARQQPMPVAVLGFIDNMREAMAVADLVVAKAGGMTVAEALGQRVPLILYHAIPGQERFNARYVAQHGAAVIAHRPVQVASVVRRCLDDPAYLGALRDAAASLGRPDAAEAIVMHVVEPLLRSEADHPSLPGSVLGPS